MSDGLDYVVRLQVHLPQQGQTDGGPTMEEVSVLLVERPWDLYHANVAETPEGNRVFVVGMVEKGAVQRESDPSVLYQLMRLAFLRASQKVGQKGGG